MAKTIIKSSDQKITVKVNEENPEPMEVIAKVIIEVSSAFERLERGPVKRKVIVLLIHDMTGLPQKVINNVIDASLKLKGYYLK